MQRAAAVPFVLTGVILCSLRAAALQHLRHPPNRIAVVGAGIGGTSAAYFLRQKFGKHVQIDVFEKGEVGGRLSTVEIEGNQYEIGGSIIHPLNLHMKTFVKDLGLNTLTLNDNLAGIYNGDEFVFEESEWFLINVIKMLWNYGLNFLRIHMWVEDFLDKFMRIYRYQTFDYSFSTTESLLHAMGGEDFTTKLNTTIGETLQTAGFSQKFINHIVVAAMRINYGQGTQVNSFVGAVSLAGTSSGLWAVEGGNHGVCTGLLYASKAQMIRGTVTSVQEKVRPTKSGETTRLYEINYETDKGPALDMYDIVIFATPLSKETGNVKFIDFDPPINTYPRPFYQMVTSLVHGQINASFFGCPKPCQFSVSDIFTTEEPKLFFHSIGPVSPVKPGTESASDTKVWRIFSPEPLEDEQLRLLFESYDTVIVKKWLAYPIYVTPEKLPPIILHHDIYYLNSIEWAASEMETSAVSAKNIALLAYHRWFGKDGQIDQEDLEERLKSEL